ncbi:sensor histidine kinase [Alicyclobacillus curvatus]|nr:sensor histidine kinase [Alicyclobacillus curvatus]
MTGTSKQKPNTRPLSLDWLLRGSPYWVGGVGYFFGLFLEGHTLVNFLLLTGIYGAWLLIYHFGKKRSQALWILALSCLAFAALFIPTQSSNAYWLPILPTMTACVTTTVKRRYLNLITAGTLLLSTSIAFGLVTGRWELGSQIIILVSFVSFWGMTVTINKLAAAHAQLQEYSAQIEELSVMRERNRIARDIHDTLGHSLTLLAVQLETATQLAVRGDSRLYDELQAARRVSKACLTEVRHSVEALRLDETYTRSLHEQIRHLAMEFEVTCPQTSITLDLDEETCPLHPEVGLALYRCAQEALTNIRKHANATKVLLRLTTAGTRKNNVELTALDNGQGSTSSREQMASGFGLLGMAERVALLEGILRAGPEPETGWRVEVVLPQKIQE